MTAQFGCEQTGKFEFRAWVPWRAQRHWIGYRDNQADALKAARRVWHSLRGDWSAGSDAILRDDFRSAFDKSVFQQDGLVEIIAGPHGDHRRAAAVRAGTFSGRSAQRRSASHESAQT